MRALNFFIGLVIILTAGAGAEWEVETLDFDNDLTAVEGFGLGNDDNPILIYTGDALKCAWREGRDWVISSVDAGADRIDGLGVTLDSLGGPHVTYYYYIYDYEKEKAFPCPDLRYARWTGNGWESETVDAEADIYAEASIALGLQDEVHISYFDNVNRIKYANVKDGKWDISTVDASAEGPVHDTAIDVDSQNRPHIAYFYRENFERKLKYAFREGGEWVLETVDPVARAGNVSIALDAEGRPHVSYFDALRGDLKYAHRTAAGWLPEVVDSAGWVGERSSINVNEYNVPVIAYYHKYDVKFAFRDNNRWRIQTVERGVGTGKYERGDAVSVALDSRGNPHVLYYDQIETVAKYARWRGKEFESDEKSPEIIIGDKSDEVNVVTWDSDSSLITPGEPWEGLISFRLESEVFSKPGGWWSDDFSEKTGVVDDSRPVEVIDGISKWELLSDAPETEGYRTYFKVKQGDVKGWASGVTVIPHFAKVTEGWFIPPVAVAYFKEDYSALREGPSAKSPPVKKETSTFIGWPVNPEVPAGRVLEFNGRVRDWVCCGRVGSLRSGGWLPVVTSQLDYYFLTFAWYTRYDKICFFFPATDYIERIIYLVRGGFHSRFPYEDPVLTVFAGGRGLDLEPRPLTGYYHRYGINEYFEVLLPEPVKRSSIDSVAFTSGTAPERFRVNVDPREAWAEYDAGR
jgi:hypothetical protein